MKTIQFSELVQTGFDIHDIIVIDHHWDQNDSFTTPSGGRPDNGIMLLTNCGFEYMQGGEVCDRAERGMLVYSPIGSEYSCRFVVPEKRTVNYVSNYLINFRLFTEAGEEFRLSDDRIMIRPEDYNRIRDGFEQISSLRKKGLSSLARIKSRLYELLCDISAELQKRDVLSHRFAAIYPAIKYLRSTDLAVVDAARLAPLCHISDSCLRRLFREYFGMPPLEYITGMKIRQATERLSSGMMTVAEVAESLGFSDASYFSRVYKRATGHSPREDMG